MIVDLSTPRLLLKDMVNGAIFDAKMNGFRLNRYQLTSFLAAAIIFGCEHDAFAFESGVEVNENLTNDIYAIIFALGEIPKVYTLQDIKNIYGYAKTRY